MDKIGLRVKAINMLKPPFKYEHGYIFDSDHNMVTDDHECETVAIARLRGLGRLGKLEDGEAIQDAIGELVADALTDWFETNT